MAHFDYNRHLFLEDTLFSPSSRNLTGIKMTRMLNALKYASNSITIVDLGCGVGSFTKRIKEFKPDNVVVGFDISKPALALAIQRNRQLDFVCGDVLNLPFADVSVEAISGFDILEHLENIGSTVREIHRVLKPAGMAHFHIPCEGQPWTLWWFLWKTRFPGRDLKRKHAGHVQRFTQKGILEIFSEHGFDVINIEYSVHMVGQILDFLQWWATSVRRRMSVEGTGKPVAPEDTPPGDSRASMRLIFGAYRFVVRVLEIYSYFETKIFNKLNLAMAVDVTLRKR